MRSASLTSIEQDGYYWIRGSLPSLQIEELAEALRIENRPGSRVDLAHLESTASLAMNTITHCVNTVIHNAKCVRAVGFNKTASLNWGVGWHQDRVIEVDDRYTVLGYENWTRKSGAWHCEAPESILEDMVFARVFLDDANEENGAMEIAIGSHLSGKVTVDKAAIVASNYPQKTMSGKAGDILILPMLTLHRSKSSTNDQSRRALRLDFSLSELPSPLRWRS